MAPRADSTYVRFGGVVSGLGMGYFVNLGNGPVSHGGVNVPDKQNARRREFTDLQSRDG